MRSQAGFTLIEVIIALAVVAIGLAAALSVSATHIDAMSRLEQQNYALWVAQNRLAELRLGIGERAVTGEKKGGVESMAGRDWYWKQQARETFDQSIIRVQVDVSADREGESRLALLTGYAEAVR